MSRYSQNFDDFSDVMKLFPDFKVPEENVAPSMFSEEASYLDHLDDPRWHRQQIVDVAERLPSVEEAWTLLQTDFPRIYAMLKEAWNAEVQNKIARLLWVDTEGRQGFPKKAVDALMILQQANVNEFGELALENKQQSNFDFW
jgi:hypothetical protein